MAMQEEEIRAHILEALPDAVVEVTDLAGVATIMPVALSVKRLRA